MSAHEVADWCVDSGSIAICGTDMEEYARESMGERWCFTCRVRHEFWCVCKAPTGFSYYGPTAHVEGVKRWCSDLFPGWSREAVDE